VYGALAASFAPLHAAACARLCIRKRTHTLTHTHTHTLTHIYTHVYLHIHVHTHKHTHIRTCIHTRTHMQSEADMLQLLGQLSAANAITDTQMNKVCVRACMFRSVCDLRCLNPEAPVQSKTWNISRGFNVAVHYYIIKLHLAPLQPCLLMHALSP
jgi:hypothetical protein